ncbi:hypothetical protein MYX65_05675 [Acidobacteria bacterium AH-259-L09]|nr:hypothetical protein [Acidobacteria bacterium AH-259-L09]
MSAHDALGFNLANVTVLGGLGVDAPNGQDGTVFLQQQTFPTELLPEMPVKAQLEEKNALALNAAIQMSLGSEPNQPLVKALNTGQTAKTPPPMTRLEHSQQQTRQVVPVVAVKKRDRHLALQPEWPLHLQYCKPAQ